MSRNNRRQLEHELKQGIREIPRNTQQLEGIADRIMAAIYTAYDYKPKGNPFAGKNTPRGYGHPSDIKEIYGTE